MSLIPVHFIRQNRTIHAWVPIKFQINLSIFNCHYWPIGQ